MMDLIVGCYGVTLHRKHFSTLPSTTCLLAWNSSHNPVATNYPHATPPFNTHPALLINPSQTTCDRFFYPIEIAYGAYTHYYAYPIKTHKFNWQIDPSTLSLAGSIKLDNMQSLQTYPPPFIAHTSHPTGLEEIIELLKSNSTRGFFFKGGFVEKYLGQAMGVPTCDLAHVNFPPFRHGQPWTDASRTSCSYHTAYHDLSCPQVRVKATQNFLLYRNLPRTIIQSIITQYQQARQSTPLNQFSPFVPVHSKPTQ